MCCCHDGFECDSRGETGRKRGAPRACFPQPYERAQGQVALDQRGSRQGVVERSRDRRVGESEGSYSVAVLFVVEESGRARQADTYQHVSVVSKCLVSKC